MHKNIIVVLFAILLFASCKNDSVNFSDTTLQEKYDAYSKLKNETSAKEFASEIVAFTINNPDSPESILALEKGVEVADAYSLTPSKISFLTTMIKKEKGSENNQDRILNLSESLIEIGKEKAGNALLLAYSEKYKNADQDKVKSLLTTEVESSSDFIKQIGESIFEDPDQYGINRKNAQSYVDAVEAYVMVNPGSAMAPEFLYKAAEVAQTLKTYPKALSLFDWLVNDYPDFEKSATILFLKGFMLENDLNDIEAARETYQLFLNKYPNHKLSKDVSFLLENIGKTDEEIMEIITKKNNG